MLRLIKRLLGVGSSTRRPSPSRPRARSPQPSATSEVSGASPSSGPPEPLLYKFDSCPFCRRVARAIDDLGLSIATRDTRKEPGAREELLARTGRTQVPCLFIDGEPLFESADIVDWLRANADRVGPPLSA